MKTRLNQDMIYNMGDEPFQLDANNERRNYS